MARSLSAFRKALERHDLLTLAGQSGETVTVVTGPDELLHHSWCRVLHGRHPTPESMLLIDLLNLNQSHLCPDCSSSIPNSMCVVVVLLEAIELAAAGQRFAANPVSKVPGRAQKLRNELTSRVDRCARLRVTGEQVAHRDRAVALMTEAQQALRSLGQSTQIRAQILGWVMADLLVPDVALLDSSATLVAIPRVGSPANRIKDLLAAYEVATPDQASMVLVCPRFVCDYLNRHLAAGSSWMTPIFSRTVAGLPPEQVVVAARLWSATPGSPMMNLDAALEMAASVIADPAAVAAVAS